MKPHQILLSWSDDDQLYVAQVPVLPGCMAHGESEEEAARAARVLGKKLEIELR